MNSRTTAALHKISSSTENVEAAPGRIESQLKDTPLKTYNAVSHPINDAADRIDSALSRIYFRLGRAPWDTSQQMRYPINRAAHYLMSGIQQLGEHQKTRDVTRNTILGGVGGGVMSYLLAKQFTDKKWLRAVLTALGMFGGGVGAYHFSSPDSGISPSRIYPH